MGGSKPTPPTIIMPEESNPQAFQTIIPQKSYKDLAESMRRTEKEINRIIRPKKIQHYYKLIIKELKKNCQNQLFYIFEKKLL